MKKLTALFLAAIMVLAVAGCGAKPAEPAPSPAAPALGGTATAAPAAPAPEAPKETVTLRMWGGVPPEAGPQASCDAFNAAFKDKGIQVEYERFVNDDTGNLKLETSLLGGTDVDIYVTYTTAVLQKRSSGNMALDLTTLIERDKFDVVGTFGEMAKSFYIDGKPYSIPTKLDQYGIVLNKTMFDAAGIPIPTDWTMDEFRETAKKLTHGEGQEKVYGMFWNSQQDLLYPFTYLSVQTLGGDPLYNPDGTANINNAVNVASIDLINNMMNVDKTSPTHTDSVTQKLSQEGMFLTGKSAMTIGPWMVRSIKDKTTYPHDFETAFAPYPVYKTGERKFTQGGYGDHLCISPKSKNIDAAWEFVKWYATEGMLPVVEGGRVPAANTYDPAEVTKAFLKGAEDHIDSTSASKVLIAPAPNHAVPSITKKLPEINKVLQEELENIYTGQQTVQQGMDKAQQRAVEQLAK